MTEPITVKTGVETGVFLRDEGETLLMVQFIGGTVMIHERPVNDPSEEASSGGLYPIDLWDQMVQTVEHQRKARVPK